MPTLTELLDKPVRDPNGEAFASLRALVVRIGHDTYPPVIGLVARLK